MLYHLPLKEHYFFWKFELILIILFVLIVFKLLSILLLY